MALLVLLFPLADEGIAVLEEQFRIVLPGLVLAPVAPGQRIDVAAVVAVPILQLMAVGLVELGLSEELQLLVGAFAPGASHGNLPCWGLKNSEHNCRAYTIEEVLSTPRCSHTPHHRDGTEHHCHQSEHSHAGEFPLLSAEIPPRAECHDRQAHVDRSERKRQCLTRLHEEEEGRAIEQSANPQLSEQCRILLFLAGNRFLHARSFGILQLRTDVADRDHHEQVPAHDDQIAEDKGLVVACAAAETFEVHRDPHEQGSKTRVEHAALLPVFLERCLETGDEPFLLQQRFQAGEGRVHVRRSVLDDTLNSQGVRVEGSTQLPRFRYGSLRLRAIGPSADHHSPEGNDGTNHAENTKALAKNGRGQGVHHEAERHHGLCFCHRPHGQGAHLVDEPCDHEDRVKEHPDWEHRSCRVHIYDQWFQKFRTIHEHPEENLCHLGDDQDQRRNQHHHAHPGQGRDLEKLLLGEEDVLASGRGDEKQSVHGNLLIWLYQATFAWICLNCKP